MVSHVTPGVRSELYRRAAWYEAVVDGNILIQAPNRTECCLYILSQEDKQFLYVQFQIASFSPAYLDIS